MTTFTGTAAIALTWNTVGQCRGVRVQRVRDRCRVVRWWEEQKGADRSVAETLAEGLRALDPGGGAVVVAGGEDITSGVIDLDMPALRLEELRNALSFELRRYAPVPDEKLTSAYRLLPGKAGARARVRLYYLRQTEWERWMNEVSALAHGLDMVIPPAAALDPVLSGLNVCLGVGNARFLYVAGPDGHRDVLALPEATEQPAAFGCGPSPLEAACLDPGELAQFPIEKQAVFASALVLAMYGLSRGFHADRRTGFELPYELRPRRHRQSQLIALVLAIYTVAAGLYGSARLYADRRRQFDAVHGERLRVEAMIDEATKRLQQDDAKALEQVRQEIADLGRPRPSLAAALAEITRRTGHAGWCTSFRWSEGAVSIQLRESQEIADLERTLEQSPLLGDVRQESVKVQAGVTERKVEMNARYDLGNEKSAPPPSTVPATDQGEAVEDESEEDGPQLPKPPAPPTAPSVDGAAALPAAPEPARVVVPPATDAPAAPLAPPPAPPAP